MYRFTRIAAAALTAGILSVGLAGCTEHGSNAIPAGAEIQFHVQHRPLHPDRDGRRVRRHGGQAPVQRLGDQLVLQPAAAPDLRAETPVLRVTVCPLCPVSCRPLERGSR